MDFILYFDLKVYKCLKIWKDIASDLKFRILHQFLKLQVLFRTITPKKELVNFLQIRQLFQYLTHFLDKFLSLFITRVYINLYIWEIETFNGIRAKSSQYSFEWWQKVSVYNPRIICFEFDWLWHCSRENVLVESLARLADTN